MLGVENIGKSLFFVWSLCTWSVWQNGTDLSENVILRGILDFLKASVLFNTFLYLTEQWDFWREMNEILSNIQAPYKLNQTFVLFSFILGTRLLEKNHHTIMYDTSFSYYIILRGLSQGWVWKTRNKIKLGNEDCNILFS